MGYLRVLNIVGNVNSIKPLQLLKVTATAHITTIVPEGQGVAPAISIRKVNAAKWGAEVSMVDVKEHGA